MMASQTHIVLGAAKERAIKRRAVKSIRISTIDLSLKKPKRGGKDLPGVSAGAYIL